MKFRLLLSLLILITSICSCQREGGVANEKEGRIDIHAFIVTEVTKFWGSNKSISLPSNETPTTIPYKYSRDKDGFQILIMENKVAELAVMLQKSYGPPKLARTNSTGLFSFSYAIDQVGVAIDCGIDVEGDGSNGKQFTHLVVVKASALRSRKRWLAHMLLNCDLEGGRKIRFLPSGRICYFFAQS